MGQCASAALRPVWLLCGGRPTVRRGWSTQHTAKSTPHSAHRKPHHGMNGACLRSFWAPRRFRTPLGGRHAARRHENRHATPRAQLGAPPGLARVPAARMIDRERRGSRALGGGEHGHTAALPTKHSDLLNISHLSIDLAWLVCVCVCVCVLLCEL